MTLEECRQFFAEEIRFTATVRSLALLEAFARVPREEFLGPGPWEIASADNRGLSALGAVQMSYTSIDDPRQLYHNVVVVLDKAADINNGQPSALACWIDALDLQSGERAPTTWAVASAITRLSWQKSSDQAEECSPVK